MTKRRDDVDFTTPPMWCFYGRLCRRRRRPTTNQSSQLNWLSQYDPETLFFFFSFLSMLLLLLLWIYGMGKGMEDRELCLYWAEPAGCPLYLLHIPLATLWRANGLPTSIVIQPLGAFSPFIFRRKRKNFVLFLFFLLWNSEMSVNIDMLVIMSYRPRPSMNLLLEYLIVLFFFYIKE